jgi:hypothetical protein
MKNNAMELFDELEKSLRGLELWEKERIEVKFLSLPEVNSLLLLDRTKEILLVNTYLPRD